jgi:hypothetical protein
VVIQIRKQFGAHQPGGSELREGVVTSLPINVTALGPGLGTPSNICTEIIMTAVHCTVEYIYLNIKLLVSLLQTPGIADSKSLTIATQDDSVFHVRQCLYRPRSRLDNAFKQLQMSAATASTEFGERLAKGKAAVREGF